MEAISFSFGFWIKWGCQSIWMLACISICWIGSIAQAQTDTSESKNDTPSLPKVFEGIIPAQDVLSADSYLRSDTKHRVFRLDFYHQNERASVYLEIGTDRQDVADIYRKWTMRQVGPNWPPRESVDKAIADIGENIAVDTLPKMLRNASGELGDDAHGWIRSNRDGGSIAFRRGLAVVNIQGEIAFDEIIRIARALDKKLTPEQVDSFAKEMATLNADDKTARSRPPVDKATAAKTAPELIARLESNFDEGQIMGGKAFSQERLACLIWLHHWYDPKVKALALPVYIAHLDPKYSPEIRMVAIQSPYDQRAIEPLKSILNEPIETKNLNSYGSEARLRGCVIRALARIDDSSVIPFLEEVAAREQEFADTKTQAQSAIKRLKEKAAAKKSEQPRKKKKGQQ